MVKPNGGAWEIATMWYGADMLPRLRRLDPETLKRVAQQASDLSAVEPLHLHRKQDLAVEAWGEDKLTGGQVVALMMYGLWVMCGEDEEKAGALLDIFPQIRDAANLVTLFEKVEAEQGK